MSIIADYWEIGFPVNIDQELFILSAEVKNRTSALIRTAGLNKYFNTETKAGAMLGPFQSSPFKNINYSPYWQGINPTGE